MQFLGYIVVLMVSASTILLELHWLTSPSPQPKPAVQASANTPAPRPATEGPNAELSPIYPKPETPRPVAAAEASAPGSPAADAKAEPMAPTPVAPAAPATENTKVQSAPEPSQTTPTTKVETTGAATPVDAAQPALSTATFTPAIQTTTATPTPPAGAMTKNKCDVSACAAAYASFQASDCTYQPFEGPRQVCVKPPAATQKTASAPRAPNVDTRKRHRDEELRDVEREVRRVTPHMADIDDDDVIVIRRPRW